MPNEDLFPVGTPVEKSGGEYSFPGTVVASFYKLGGERRYVVEDDRKSLHIFSAKNLVLRVPTANNVLGDQVLNAVKSFLRVCATGGMPSSQRQRVEASITEANRLGYFNELTKPPKIRDNTAKIVTAAEAMWEQGSLRARGGPRVISWSEESTQTRQMWIDLAAAAFQSVET